MPRLVRRKPFGERLRAMLNPMDFLLWLSEEMETRDWDSKVAGTQLGLGLNFVFLLARANSGSLASDDDIFSDDAGTGWLTFFVSRVLYIRCRWTVLIRFLLDLSSCLGHRCFLLRECFLHHHPNAKVSTLRSERRSEAFDALCAPC